MKRCNKCNLEKPLSRFYKDKGTKDGFSYPCKECDNKRRNVSYSKYLGAYRERHRNWSRKNKEKLNIFYWNKRGSNYHVSGKYLQNIFLKQGELCYYCKVGLRDSNFHIEHTTPQDNSKIVISCPDCNRLKWTRNEKEFREFLKKYILRFKE